MMIFLRQPVLFPMYWAGLALLILVGDYVTGLSVLFPIFFVLPVMLASWRSGRTWGYALAISLPLVRLYFAVIFQAGSWLVIGVNTTIQMIALSALAFFVNRAAAQKQELIREVAGHMRAEEELRRAHSELEKQVQDRTWEFSNAIALLKRQIAERERVEEALRESEQKYRTFIETTQEGVYTIDTEGKIGYANQRMADLLGYTVQEMLGCRSTDFMDEEGREQAQRNLERRKRGIAEIHEFRFVRKDGSDLWVLIATTPVLNASGQFTGALGMVTDITERKRAEEALRERERENARLDMLTQVTRALAHHVRNAITPILGMAELFTEEQPQFGMELKRVAMQEGRRIAAIIDALMEMSKTGNVPTVAYAGMASTPMLDLESLIQRYLKT